MLSIKPLLTLLFGLHLASSSRSPPLPPSQEICKRNPQHTNTARRSGDNGFEVFVLGSSDEYRPGNSYSIGIRGREMFNGFMLTAVASNATMEAMGSFMKPDPSQAIKLQWCPHIVSHVDFELKKEVILEWKAPKDASVCVEFRATVLEQHNSWFKDEGKLTKIFCPEDIPEASMADEGPCCACGSAKYEMVFEGIWSDKSHPINYPTQKRLLHWSNIVGASHNDKYHIWRYGGYATKGVKEICELGYPRTLEGEVKKQSMDVRTLIKTTGIWWKDPEGIVQNRTARFTTDTKRHFVSVITMLGPSPDWCVGISAVNVCQKDCTWSDGFVLDLSPWDAGTDDGISYMSPNAKSEPQKRIRKMTNRWPNDAQSPFYGPHPITPVARIHVRKIGDTKPSDPAQCDESTLTDFIGDGSTANVQQAISVNCMVSDWDDWSRCSVTCGVGTRSRRRMYKERASEGECDVPLMEKENCIGIENECENINEDCAVTQWSDWSPCSVTCAQGHRERIRYYFNAEEKERCDRTTVFREVCYGTTRDCRAIRKPYSDCLKDMMKGPCRGEFSKWYFDVGMQKCLEFEYGGCRGNENRFESMDECMNVCSGGEPKKEEEEDDEGMDKTFCMAPSDRGTCGGHEEMWFFDKNMQKCLQFDYSGCGGNKNRFKSMDECSDSCQLAGLEGGGEDDMVVKCQQPALEGTCSQDLERWYFDTQMQKCLPFQYGGCGSNDNNFETMDECTEVCTLNAQLQDALLKKAIHPNLLHNTGLTRYKRFCTLPQEKGPCRDSIERWYFDLSTLKCLPFQYGGCVGNANNFETTAMCEQDCLGRSMSNHTKPATSTTAPGSSASKEGQQSDEVPKEMMQKVMKMRKKSMNCKASKWSAWSVCSATCGRGQRMKTRKIVQQRVGKGKKCPRMLTKKQSCRRLPSCQTKCHYGPWSRWSPCSSTCGMASFKQRTKTASHPRRSPRGSPIRPHPSSKCPDKRQRIRCRLPKCPK